MRNENQTAPPPHPPGGFSPRQEAWRTLNQTDASHPDAAQNLHERLDRREIPEADRRLATQLVMGVLRHRGRLDYCLSQILDKPLERQRAPILNLLRLGLYQILYLDHAPDYAIAHETVEAIRHSEMKDAAGLVNGVLRACLRRRDELAAPPDTGDPDRDFGALHSCPEWIRAALDDVLPEKGMRAWWMRAQEIPALHLRVNTLKTDKESLIAELRAAGFDPQPTPVPDVLAVSGTQRPDQLPCFEQGRAAIQDAAAALVGHLVAPRPGERIVDLCSAPGGKTAHLAALAGDQAQILAADASKTRLDEVPKILGRLGVRNAQFAMATQLLIAQYGNWADAVLVDAPCTGMGTIRRHPEIRWLREREDVIQASLKQLMILGLAQQMVRPGGRMIYSTCTLFYEENRRVIETFLDSYRHFSLVDARQTAPDFLQPYLMPDGMLFTPIHPAFAMDGFFAAVLRRNG